MSKHKQLSKLMLKDTSYQFLLKAKKYLKSIQKFVERNRFMANLDLENCFRALTGENSNNNMKYVLMPQSSSLASANNCPFPLSSQYL